MSTTATTPLDLRERVAIARLHALLELLPAALDRHLAPAGITSFEYTLLDALESDPTQRLRLSNLAGRTNAQKTVVRPTPHSRRSAPSLWWRRASVTPPPRDPSFWMGSPRCRVTE